MGVIREFVGVRVEIHMKKNRYKKIVEHQLEDFRFFLEHPIEYEVFQEEYLYVKRFGIRSKDSFSLGKNLLFTPDVDAVSVLQLSSGDPNLFTRLLAAGIKSPLIQHFSECEERGEAYTDPETGFILWVRVPVVDFLPESAKENNNITQPIKMLYSLGGGFDYFHRLLAVDKDFLSGLFEGFRRGLCSPYRIDLCVDCSDDIMSHVNEALTTGHYESFSRHPFGMGWLGGKRIEGPVGKYSANFERFGKEQLKLDTVYFGKPKRNNYVVIFYDKQTERREREKSRWPNKSRIEVRIFARDSESKSRMLNILQTYISDGPGWKKRTEIFCAILYNHVKFTTNKRNRNKNINPMAPWWRSLLGTLIHPLLKQNPKEGGSLNDFNFLLSKTFEDRPEGAFFLSSGQGAILDKPLKKAVGDPVSHDSEKKNGRATLKKKQKKDLKVSSFDRIFQLALELSKKEEYKRFREFHRKFSIHKFLSKEEIRNIKSRFWLLKED